MILLRIWSGAMAAVFAAVETYINLTLPQSKPLPILLPYYVIAVWLVLGALLPSHRSRFLISGWGVTLGYTYLAYVENLLLRDSSLALLTALRNTTVAAVLSLALAIYCARAASRDSAICGHHLAAIVRYMGAALGVLVLGGQISTTWGQGKPPAIVVPYFGLAAVLVLLAFTPRPRPILPLSAWSIAFGFLYAEFSGFLVFFQRPAPVVALAGVAATVALAGVVLQSVAMARGPRSSAISAATSAVE